MMSTNNILHPANGSPIIVPSQDIVLGLYYCEHDEGERAGRGHGVRQHVRDPACAGQRHRGVTLHTKIKARTDVVDEEGNLVSRVFETTPGRMLVGELLPRFGENVSFDLVNKLLTKREISAMIDVVYRHCGQKETVIFCDQIMALGFNHACKAGISFGKDDMVIPDTKEKLRR